MREIPWYHNGQHRNGGGHCDHQAEGLHIVLGDIAGGNAGTTQVIALYDGPSRLAYRAVEMPARQSTARPGMTRAQATASALAEWAPVYAALRELGAAQSALALATDGYADWQWEQAEREQDGDERRALMRQREQSARADLPATRARAERATAAVLLALADTDPATSPADIERQVAEFQLTHWREMNVRRDQIVMGAVAAGISKHRIHALTGISRTTIDRIPGLEP